MTCKDCIHYAVCAFTSITSKKMEKDCKRFKNEADVVEVVRCPDCKHCIKDTEYSKKINMGYCEYDNTVHQRTHFCGYGERRKDDE